MACLTKVNIQSNERLDLNDFQNIERFSAEDWNAFTKYLLTNKSYIVSGMIPYQDASLLVTNPSSSPIYIDLKGSSILHTDGINTPYMYVGSQKLGPEKISLVSSATNYIEVDLISTTSSEDTRSFWDPTANGQQGAEFAQIVNTAIDLTVSITVNQTGWSGGTKVPLYKVILTGSVITAFKDARDLFFRLGKGDDTTYKYPWDQGQSEPSDDRKIDANALTGADKGIKTFKDFIDAIYTEIAAIKGTAHWFDNGTSGVSDLSLNNLFFDSAASILSGNGNFVHSAVTPGLLTWDSTIQLRSVIGDLTYTIPANSVTLADKQIAYILLDRNVLINQNFSFVNGSNTVTAPAGSFVSISVGDWVKSESHDASKWRKVTALTPVTPSLATSITLDSIYQGATTTSKLVKSKSSYTVQVANAINVPASGDVYWLAKRDDNGAATARIFLRGLAEIEQGENRPISDNQTTNVLDYMGSPGEADSTPDYTNAVTTSLAEVFKITLPPASSITSGQYFTAYSASDFSYHYFWFNKDGLGGNPLIGGALGHEISITTGDSNIIVATTTKFAIDALTEFDAVDNLDGTTTVTLASVGVTTDAINGNVGGIFAINILTQGTGSKNVTIIDNENLTKSIKRLDEALAAVANSLTKEGYEEKKKVVTGAPANDNEVTGPISALTDILLPLNSRNSDIQQIYTVGTGILTVFLNGVKLILGSDYSEVGLAASNSSLINTSIQLEIDDELVFRIESSNAGASSGGGGGGGTYTGTNLGGTQDADVFKQVALNQFEFRRLTAGTNVSIVQNANNIVISSSAGIGSSTVSTFSANHTLTPSEDVAIINTSSGDVTITLPDAASVPGKIYYLKKKSLNNLLKIKTVLSQTLDEVDISTTTLDLNIQYDSITIVSDGSNWWAL